MFLTAIPVLQGSIWVASFSQVYTKYFVKVLEHWPKLRGGELGRPWHFRKRQPLTFDLFMEYEQRQMNPGAGTPQSSAHHEIHRIVKPELVDPATLQFSNCGSTT
jgi:hypothetical protein